MSTSALPEGLPLWRPVGRWSVWFVTGSDLQIALRARLLTQTPEPINCTLTEPELSVVGSIP